MADKSSERLKNNLPAKGGANLPEKSDKPKTMAEQLEVLVPQFARALPMGSTLTPERISRLALTLFRQKPQLAQCTPQSFFGALMKCASHGLEPDINGMAYLVPFRNKYTNTLECQFILGYKGMLQMVRRSGETIGTPKSRMVYDNDVFNLVYGYEADEFQHIPWWVRKDESIQQAGKPMGAYLQVRYKSGGADIFFLPMADIIKHQDRSQAGNDGPWKTDFEAMCLKTVVRAFFAWLPASIEDRALVERSDGRINQLNLDTQEEDVIDITDASSNAPPPTNGEGPATGQPQTQQPPPNANASGQMSMGAAQKGVGK